MYVEDSVSETRCSSGLFWLSFWPPSVEALGREGPVPASISPPVGLRTGLGMGVLSNGVLNGHPSFSGNSCALRANQLECLRMVERRQVLEGWGFSKPGRVHSLAPWFLMSWDFPIQVLQNFPIQVLLDPWVGLLSCAGLQMLGVKCRF